MAIRNRLKKSSTNGTPAKFSRELRSEYFEKLGFKVAQARFGGGRMSGGGIGGAAIGGMPSANGLLTNDVVNFSRFNQLAGPGEQKSIRLDAECGYPDPSELTPEYFRNAYKRWGIAARVVNIWPDETWASHPEVYESEDEETKPFEAGFEMMQQRTQAFHFMHRVDRLSGIGRFGVMYLGLSDRGRLDRPPEGIDFLTGKRTRKFKPCDLMYIRVFDESTVKIIEKDDNKNSPRCGEAKMYEVTLSSEEDQADIGQSNISSQRNTKGKPIHWTRMIHVPSDDLMTSEIFGQSRLENVINYLHDVRKVSGGSSEMFWAGGFPGYAFESFPDTLGVGTTDELDDESLREDMEAFNKGLKRYLATEGGKWSSLQPQVANPDRHLQWLLRLICITKGVPLRIFIGSESGQQAGMQDDAAWRTRCSGRQRIHNEPRILRPFTDRCIEFGCVPAPEVKQKDGKYLYYTNWKDLRALSDDARVGVALKKVQALMAYVTGNANFIMPERHLLTLVMGFTEDEADSILAELKRSPPKPLVPPPPVVATGTGKPPGGGRNNVKPPRGTPNRPAGKSAQPKKGIGRPSESSRRGSKRSR